MHALVAMLRASPEGLWRLQPSKGYRYPCRIAFTRLPMAQRRYHGNAEASWRSLPMRCVLLKVRLFEPHV
jgi:hypothetical protein